MMIWCLSQLVLADDWTPNEPDVEPLWELHDREKWNELGPLIKEYLKLHPESYSGHAILGRLYWRHYGAHARALNHLLRAQELYDLKLKGSPNEPWRRHSLILDSLQQVHGDMAQSDLELETLEQFNNFQLYAEEQFGSFYELKIGEYGWPLMKLERYDEALSYANRAINSSNVGQQSLGHNVSCAVNAERGDRLAALEACEGALEHSHATEGSSAIDASNASNASFMAFEFAKVERYGLESVESYGRTAPGWLNLLDLYLLQGRGPTAIEALKSLRQAVQAEPIHQRSQRASDVDVSFAQILYLAGEDRLGMKVMNRVLERPDRRGAISTSEEQAQGSHTMNRYAMRNMSYERERERLASQGFWGWIRSQFVGLWSYAQLVDRLTVRGLLVNKTRLSSTFRMYVDKGLTNIPSWMMGDLVELLGTGVARAAVEDAANLDKHPAVRGYHAALLADAAYLDGELVDVNRHTQEALEKLPQAERLLRMRMSALKGWAAYEMDNVQPALMEWSTVFANDPSLFRRYGWSVPVKIDSKGGKHAQELEKRLLYSPRFSKATEGFTLQITGGDLPRICLIGLMGEELGCSGYVDIANRGEYNRWFGVESWEQERITDEQSDENDAQSISDQPLNDEEMLRFLIDQLHQDAFGLPLGESGLSLNSLDGSTTTSREQAHRNLKELLAPKGLSY